MASQARAQFYQLAGLGAYPRSRAVSTRVPNSKGSLNSRMQSDRQGALALAATYTAAAKGKRAYTQAYRSIREFYLVDAIVTAIVEDSLTPDITTGEVVEVTSNNVNLNKKLKELSKSVNFDQLVRDIAPDLIGNGEYTIKVNNSGGETTIRDNVDQEKIVAFYDKGFPSEFLIEGARDVKIAKPHEYAHFVIGDFKIRLKISEHFEEGKKEIQGSIPEYARIGKPLFYGTIGKIKELQLLESLVPASKLNQITRGSIVGVGVPSASTPEEAFDVCRRYENVFNSSTGIDAVSGEVSVSDIIGVAGKVKAVPLFGDKGSLESIGDAKNNQSVDDLLSTVKDLREVICTSIGFPPELLFGGESKAELLKRYARYLRKLKSVQSALSNGIKQIVLTHLNNEEETRKDKTEVIRTSFSLDDISVRFRNELVNIDELEKLEFSDAMISTVKETFEFMTQLLENESTNSIVNEEGIHGWLYNIFRLISTTHDMILPPDEADIAKRRSSKKAKPAQVQPVEEPEEPETDKGDEE